MLYRNWIDQLKEILRPGGYVESGLSDGAPIPGASDNRLTFGNTAVRFEAVTFYVDMRGSTQVLQKHRAVNVAKVHKAFLFAATKLLEEGQAHIRSYNGDSILAFFRGTSKKDISRAVKTAMQLVFLCGASEEIRKEFEQYSGIDFGIGIDLGQVLCVKAGKGGNENWNDLIWLGDAVNRATRLSDKANAENGRIWISKGARDLLEDEVKFNTKDGARVDMWVDRKLSYAQQDEEAWSTPYHWKVS
ncbi:MAG: adenylate/guanylate cyclase domain-containing protein [Polyangiaceae bacterium]|nr:adenylate/guanylate cyclase domain-containing protein [Polyangiaceae bacterium]